MLHIVGNLLTGNRFAELPRQLITPAFTAVKRVTPVFICVFKIVGNRQRVLPTYLFTYFKLRLVKKNSLGKTAFAEVLYALYTN